MTKHAPGAKQVLGVICKCGAKFPAEKQLLEHIEKEANMQEPEAQNMTINEDGEIVGGDSASGSGSETNPSDAQPEQQPPTKVTAKAEIVVKPSEHPAAGGRGISQYLNSNEVQKFIKDRIGSRVAPFINSIMAAVNGNEKLQKCTPKSLLSAAIEAAALDLSVNPNLGHAYLVPYKDQAQLQLGYKGFVQLAQRTAQYKTIGATPVYEGQLTDQNPLTGNTYDWNAKKSDKVVGYVAYFKLLNGFEKEWYMPAETVQAHAKRYSQSYRGGFGPWKDNEEQMSLKTPLKLLLSKYGLLSIEMERAIELDQGVIEGETVNYPDNTSEIEDRINEASSRKEVEEIMHALSVDERKALANVASSRIRQLA